MASKDSTDYFRKDFEFGFKSGSELAQKGSWQERNMAEELEGVYTKQWRLRTRKSTGTESMGK